MKWEKKWRDLSDDVLYHSRSHNSPIWRAGILACLAMRFYNHHILAVKHQDEEVEVGPPVNGYLDLLLSKDVGWLYL